MAVSFGVLPELGAEGVGEIADLVVNAEEQQPAERTRQTVVRIAFVPLRMLSQALRELFRNWGASRTASTTRVARR